MVSTPERATRPRHSFSVPANPMLCSGLALAGAGYTIDSWAKDEMVAPENDGIVSAEEIGCLDLRGTQLVVLSACDTGLGAVRAGEGVLGLRRGFIQAGAQSLLLTLWPVMDGQTSGFMPEVYALAYQTGSPAKALAGVQRAWLKRLRENRGIAEACVTAGPFMLSFQGPEHPVDREARSARRSAGEHQQPRPHRAGR